MISHAANEKRLGGDNGLKYTQILSYNFLIDESNGPIELNMYALSVYPDRLGYYRSLVEL